MARPRLEVADVIRAHADALFDALGSALSSARRRVLNLIATCRTAALGGHVKRCDQCGHDEVSYNSCRNRHCPKCQGASTAKWLDARAADLLPVHYFHVVFTVPAEIAAIALQNKKTMYGILMRAAAQTLLQIAADPKHLGATIGVLSVLHTWGQNLMHHPHVHCVVPGGGLSSDKQRWIPCRPGFLLPVKVLGSVFRGKFLAMTKRAFADGKLKFQGELSALQDSTEFASYLKRCYRHNWVVYSKKPFGGPTQVLKYLARYTHRVAISNHRLVALDNGRVTFRWKDYASGNKKRVMTLDAVEFLRRFSLHVLPRGFVRIRHHGFLANTCRREALDLCRTALGLTREPTEASESQTSPPDETPKCPKCEFGRLVTVGELPPIATKWLLRVARAPVPFDTS